MQKRLLALGLVATIGLVCGSASAVPINAASVSIKEAAAAGSPVQQAQFAERRTKHGVVKCYRDLVIGPYRCHHFRNGWVSFPF